MIWITSLITICVLGLLLIYKSRRRSKNEPPLDKGFIPWLGHALEFGEDVAKFLSRMKRKHGDIFTVRVAGHYITVLLDPNSYDAVLHDCGSLDSSHVRKTIIKVFGFSLHNQNPAEEKLWMARHFQGENLPSLSRSMAKNLQDLLRSPEFLQNPASWKQDGLFSICYSLLFKAGFRTLFGDEQNYSSSEMATVYSEFRKFDGLLAKIMRSTLKPEEKKMALSAREQLWTLLSPPDPLSQTTELPSWRESYQQHLREGGVDGEVQRRALLLQLWVTQCNAGPAAFWLLGFLLTNPEALQAVKKEVNGLSSSASSSQRPLLAWLQNTPVCDSALKETLRLTAAVLISRYVTQDTVLCLADGREYGLRQGDRVCLFPYISPQMDPSIHQEPERFRYDRFLNANGTVKTDFFKAERRLKYYTMPFGAGENICVGRHFALNTIKQFLFTVLTSLDLELCEPGSTMPLPDTGRFGFGMLQPDGDLQIRYRLRGQL